MFCVQIQQAINAQATWLLCFILWCDDNYLMTTTVSRLHLLRLHLRSLHFDWKVSGMWAMPLSTVRRLSFAFATRFNDRRVLGRASEGVGGADKGSTQVTISISWWITAIQHSFFVNATEWIFIFSLWLASKCKNIGFEWIGRWPLAKCTWK